MIGLLQRVSGAQVTINGEAVAEIGPGLLVFVGVEKADTETIATRLLKRLLSYRVFPDATGRMNQSVADRQGGLLLVPQFTLAADTAKGTRASFTPAAEPDQGRHLFEFLCDAAQRQWPQTRAGRFGADMQVGLVNDGPVTFWLQVR